MAIHKDTKIIYHLIEQKLPLKQIAELTQTTLPNIYQHRKKYLALKEQRTLPITLKQTKQPKVPIQKSQTPTSVFKHTSIIQPTPEDSIFTTDNLGLIAALIQQKHYPQIIEKKQAPRWLIATFNKSETITHIKETFFNNTLELPAREYMCSFFFLKRISQTLQPTMHITQQQLLMYPEIRNGFILNQTL